MKLLHAFRDQVKTLGPLRRAWFTTFNLGIPFFETHVLPVLLDEEQPLNRIDYENMQLQLGELDVDVRVFCDMRMMEADQLKRTALPIHGILPGWLGQFDEESLFHPKVIFLEDTSGRMVLGAGSANLSVSGWGRNQEVFVFREVSNNDQYQQIKRFFAPLANAAGLDIQEVLGTRRRFGGDDQDWRFVHSFEKKSFLHELLGDAEVDRLTVWSPYFSRDLALLLSKISCLAERNLKYAIVPDRVAHKHVRTEWTESIGALIRDGVLGFHDRPSQPSDSIAMTHAKLWLAHGNQSRLAVGSWNFTEPGCASFERRNVEAGILLNVEPKTRISGQRLMLGESDFCSAQLLEDEKLEVDAYPLPFDLQVCFDWERRSYEVLGQLYKDAGEACYDLRLPGVEKEIPLCWKTRRSGGSWPLDSIQCTVADNEALLVDHCYEVWLGDQMLFRGLVQESNVSHRRAQGYETLTDWVNDMVSGVDPETSSKPRLRAVLRHADLIDEDSPSAAVVAVDGLSYFRLFSAFEQFRKRLGSVGSMGELERLLFVYPGSMQEIVDKVRAQIAIKGGNPVFNWFLWQEASSLYPEAAKAYSKHREKYARTSPPDDDKWSSLKLTGRGPLLPAAVRGNSKYMQEVREMCVYGR